MQIKCKLQMQVQARKANGKLQIANCKLQIDCKCKLQIGWNTHEIRALDYVSLLNNHWSAAPGRVMRLYNCVIVNYEQNVN